MKTLTKSMKKLKRPDFNDCFYSIGLTPKIINDSEILMGDINLLDRMGYVELHYVKKYPCNDYKRYYAVIPTKKWSLRIFRFTQSGRYLNKKNEVVGEAFAKSIGEQLLPLKLEPTYILEHTSLSPGRGKIGLCRQIDFWTIHVIDHELITKYRQNRKYLKTPLNYNSKIVNILKLH